MAKKGDLRENVDKNRASLKRLGSLLAEFNRSRLESEGKINRKFYHQNNLFSFFKN